MLKQYITSPVAILCLAALMMCGTVVAIFETNTRQAVTTHD